MAMDGEDNGVRTGPSVVQEDAGKSITSKMKSSASNSFVQARVRAAIEESCCFCADLWYRL